MVAPADKRGLLERLTVFQAAQAWLSMGAELLPCQPNSKHFQAGFGPARRVIENESQARYYFEQSGFNLAVILPADLFCLDFDDFGLFMSWSDALPVDLQLTYQETTPRGFHVFYRGIVPLGLSLVPGVEVKRLCVVAPSVVAGVKYSGIFAWDFLTITDTNVLFSFLLSEEKPIDTKPEKRARAEKHNGAERSDLIGKIKSSLSLFDYASSLTELKPSPPGQERWYIGRCPLHDDKHPSFWVDVDRGLWGCFASGCVGNSGGDVINLYSRVNRVDNAESIRRLALGVTR